jgi:hypothetical protein
MAILFSGTEESKTRSHVLECFAMTKSLFISIDMNYGKDDKKEYAYIGLDRSTAIRLAKEIRRQIALLEV